MKNDSALSQKKWFGIATISLLLLPLLVGSALFYQSVSGGHEGVQLALNYAFLFPVAILLPPLAYYFRTLSVLLGSRWRAIGGALAFAAPFAASALILDWQCALVAAVSAATLGVHALCAGVSDAQILVRPTRSYTALLVARRVVSGFLIGVSMLAILLAIPGLERTGAFMSGPVDWEAFTIPLFAAGVIVVQLINALLHGRRVRRAAAEVLLNLELSEEACAEGETP